MLEFSSFDVLLHGNICRCFSVVVWRHKGSFLGLGLGEGIGFGDLGGGDIQRGSDGQSPLCSHTGGKLVDDLSEFCSGVHLIECGLF